jgi:hypothetical protein
MGTIVESILLIVFLKFLFIYSQRSVMHKMRKRIVYKKKVVVIGVTSLYSNESQVAKC